jgi:Zn-dependent peptidase ImmA (M78 family)/DNA-binding XRE family transcriptional regulator
MNNYKEASMKASTDLSNMHQRIVAARECIGLSITEAAHKLGFKHYQSLSAIEKGTRNITASELISIAQLYGRSLDYFYEADTSPDPSPLWRRLPGSNVKKEQRKFLSFLENYSTLENLLNLNKRWRAIQTKYNRDDFSKNGFEVTEELSSDIHKRLDLGSRPSCNLLNILENNLRFKILHVPLAEDVSGASIVNDDLGVGILINTSDAPWRRNFDLAHELFHIITWNIFTNEEIGNGTTKTRPEQYADAFASHLLLPREHLLNSLKEITTNNEIKIVDIIELAKDYGVSSEAILWRLKDIIGLKKSQIQKILDDPEFRSMDRTMRKNLHEEYKSPKYPQRFISLASRCLMEGKISRGTYAEYLEIERSDIDEYLETAGFAGKNYEKIASA